MNQLGMKINNSAALSDELIQHYQENVTHFFPRFISVHFLFSLLHPHAVKQFR